MYSLSGIELLQVAGGLGVGGVEAQRLAQLGAGMTDGMGEDLPRGTKVVYAPDLEVKAPESAAQRTPIIPKVVDVPGTPADDFELAAARVEDRQARAREAFERGSRELVAGLTRTQAAPTFMPDGLYLTGVQYDPTPTPDEARTARVPDGDRWLYSAGATAHCCAWIRPSSSTKTASPGARSRSKP